MQYPFQADGNIIVVRNYLQRIIKLYLTWMVIYSPLAIFHYVSQKDHPLTALLKFIRGLFFTGEQYNSWHLWYLLSTIYALIGIILLLKRKQPMKRIIALGCILFFAGILITYFTCYYDGDLSQPAALLKKLLLYSISTGRMVEGIFYIPIGMLFAKRAFDKRLCWLLLIFGFVFNYYIIDLSISEVFVAVSAIGLFGVVESIQLGDSDFFPFVRKMSTVIYFTHMYVWNFYYGIMYREKTYGLDSFVVTVLICVLIAIVYIRYDNLRKKADIS